MKEDPLHDQTVPSTVAVSVTPVMRVSMSSIVRMSVSCPAVLEDKDADEIDEEAKDGDDQQPLVLDLGGLHQPLHCLGEDEEGDE